jgi:hypothetical protein
MPRLRLSAALASILLLAPLAARADGLCEQLGKATAMAQAGFQPAEGDPITSDSGQYWHSNIQLSAGDNCSIEGHRLLSCSWEPSTPGDLKKMIKSVAACVPKAQRTVVPDPDGGPAGASFKLDQATIDVGLTADVLSLNVGP